MQGTTVTNFGTNDASPKSMGGCVSFASDPNWSEGLQVAELAFKPTSEDSQIHIQGSPITVGETKNVADDFRVAVRLEVFVGSRESREHGI